MLSIAEIRAKLADKNRSVVATLSGVAYPTINAIYKGECKLISVEYHQKLSDYLEGKSND